MLTREGNSLLMLVKELDCLYELPVDEEVRDMI
jgi:hypothetical protein